MTSTLKVGTVTEEVTVSASPVVDTKSATVATNLDAMLLDTTPGGKDIWSILEYKIPGLVFDTPDVGGNQAGLQRGFTSRGTPNAQNVQLVNGVNVGDPAAIGFSMNYYEPATFENVQVTTGAQDISMGTSGTLINMVTRSGTNRFGGQGGGTYQGKNTQWDNVDETLKQAGFRPEAQAVDYISNANIQAGGPLIANKLFYFGNVNNQQTHVNVPGYPAISPPQIPQITSGNDRDSTEIWSVSGKLNYQLGAANRFEGYGNYQWYDKPNRGAGYRRHARLEHEGIRHVPDLAGVVELGRHEPAGRRHEDRVQQYAFPAGSEDRPADDRRQLDGRAPPQRRAERADVPPAGAGHLELELLRAGALQRTPRVQVRLRSRLHPRGRDDDARGQRQPHVAQRAGHGGAAGRARATSPSSTRRRSSSARSPTRRSTGRTRSRSAG